MTDEELRQPGVAWDEAVKAFARKDLSEADSLRQFMVRSDSKLMRARIEAADPSFYANRTNFNQGSK